RLRFSGPKTSIICSPMTSLKTSIKTITYLSDTGCLEIQGASLFHSYFLHVNELKRLNPLTEFCFVLYVLRHQTHGIGLGVARLSELEIMIDIKDR
ncbi:hypothetical protein U9456_24885, partial [Escherichia coli]